MPRRPPRSTLFPYTDALPISHHRMVALCNSASRRAPLQRCLLPVRRPADALQVAEPVRGMGQRLLTRGPSPREQERTVVEELDLDLAGLRAVADLCVDPHVVLAKPPHADVAHH